jgi:site-specific recombinase XerD
MRSCRSNAEDARLQTLRVSRLQSNGVPSDFTKSQVGHSSLQTTSRYTHFTEQFQREIVERLAS